MLFFSLFLFASDNLVQKDMRLNFISATDSSASPTTSPARGTEYTAFLQKEPSALSLVAKSTKSAAQAKELLAQVGDTENFKTLTAYNSKNAQIDIAEYGKFTIMDSQITNDKFDGYYRVKDDKSKIYKLVVQNVRNFHILKSFMAELLKAYIGKDSLFKEAPQVDGASPVSAKPSHLSNVEGFPSSSATNSALVKNLSDKKGDSGPHGVVVVGANSQKRETQPLSKEVGAGSTGRTLTDGELSADQQCSEKKRVEEELQKKNSEDQQPPNTSLQKIGNTQLTESAGQQFSRQEAAAGLHEKRGEDQQLSTTSLQTTGNTQANENLLTRDWKWFGEYTREIVIAGVAALGAFALWKRCQK